MGEKCVHKGCGKTFTDPDEQCVYHPGPPEFHEGLKGWKCCKPRVLTFDEFLSISPCTTGKHSAVDDTPVPPPPAPSTDLPKPTPVNTTTTDPPDTTSSNGSQPLSTRIPLPSTPTPTLSLSELAAEKQRKEKAQQQADEDSDDASSSINPGSICRRKGCGKTYDPGSTPREEEECVYHPGAPLFHEGSKGWTCCKRRVLEFDQFMKIEGCKKRKRHCYVGKKNGQNLEKNGGGGASSSHPHTEDGSDGHRLVDDVRSDFYQTGSSVIVSFYLKKIDKTHAKIGFGADGKSVDLDLSTMDGKRFVKKVPLYGGIEPEKCQYRILGTKLELTLAKVDGSSWPVLRSDDRDTGNRIQVGRAGRA